MAKFVERCRGIIKNRGIFGFIVFVAGRLVRNTQDMVFDKDPADTHHSKGKSLPANLVVYVVDNTNYSDPELQWLFSQALAGEDAVYADGLAGNNCMVVVADDRVVVHVSFVQFDTSYKKILGEPYNVPLIGNCWTLPEYRGQGIYPFAISKCSEIMAASGFQRILISCAPDNVASIAGIKKSGFNLVRSVNTYIFITKIMFQKAREGDVSCFRFGIL